MQVRYIAWGVPYAMSVLDIAWGVPDAARSYQALQTPYPMGGDGQIPSLARGRFGVWFQTPERRMKFLTGGGRSARGC
eukprot:2738766-Rhodomonas_salina.2